LNILLAKRKPQMRLRIAFTYILTCFVILCSAQTKAVTENGDEVLLYDDGTWKSIDDNPTEEFIKTNPAVFTKDKRSSFLLKE
jgi:sulfur transfer complex TusBCD TusB component (DsrH family)